MGAMVPMPIPIPIPSLTEQKSASLPATSAADTKVRPQIHRGEFILAAMDYFLVHSMEMAAALDPDEIVEWITTAEFTLNSVYEKQAAFSRDNFEATDEMLLRLKAVLISKRHACEDFLDELWEIAEVKYLEKYGSPWDDEELEHRIKTTITSLSEDNTDDEPFSEKPKRTDPVETEVIHVTNAGDIVSIPSPVPETDLRMCESCHRPMQIAKMHCLGQLPNNTAYKAVNASNWAYVCERATCHAWVQATLEKKIDMSHMEGRWFF